jgi:hypothetical protein
MGGLGSRNDHLGVGPRQRSFYRRVEDGEPTPDKDPSAAALGRKGGKAGAANLTAKKRRATAQEAAKNVGNFSPGALFLGIDLARELDRMAAIQRVASRLAGEDFASAA